MLLLPEAQPKPGLTCNLVLNVFSFNKSLRFLMRRTPPLLSAVSQRPTNRVGGPNMKYQRLWSPDLHHHPSVSISFGFSPIPFGNHFSLFIFSCGIVLANSYPNEMMTRTFQPLRYLHELFVRKRHPLAKADLQNRVGCLGAEPTQALVVTKLTSVLVLSRDPSPPDHLRHFRG